MIASLFNEHASLAENLATAFGFLLSVGILGCAHLILVKVNRGR
jgi:hypothetical protein